MIIEYAVPEKQRVKIWITRYPETDVIIILLNRVHDAGYYQVVWDGRNYKSELERSDIYTVHIAYPNSIITYLLILNRDYAAHSVMDNLAYYRKTNHDGQFLIPLERNQD